MPHFNSLLTFRNCKIRFLIFPSELKQSNFELLLTLCYSGFTLLPFPYIIFRTFTCLAMLAQRLYILLHFEFQSGDYVQFSHLGSFFKLIADYIYSSLAYRMVAVYH